MSDVTTIAPASSEAAPAPLPTLDAVIAAAEARAAGAPAPAPQTEAPKTEPKTTPTINMDPATLRQLTKLQRENRELATKFKTADEQAKSKEITTAIEAARLAKEGKGLEALALLRGTDPDAELLALVEDHVKEAEPPKDPLTASVEEIKKKLELSEKEKADAEVATKAKQAEQMKSDAVTFATKQLDGLASKYELCALADNKAEAAEAALDGVVFLAAERKIDLDKISQEETAKLFDEAFAGVEAQFEAEGKQLEEQLAKRYRKAPKARDRAYVEDENDVPGASRTSPGISVAAPRPVKSIDDIIARAEEQAAARRRAA